MDEIKFVKGLIVDTQTKKEMPAVISDVLTTQEAVKTALDTLKKGLKTHAKKLGLQSATMTAAIDDGMQHELDHIEAKAYCSLPGRVAYISNTQDDGYPAYIPEGRKRSKNELSVILKAPKNPSSSDLQTIKEIEKDIRR